MRDNKPQYTDLEHRILELSDVIDMLNEENIHLKDIIASHQWNATEFEKDYILHEITSLRHQVLVLEKSEHGAIASRDMFQDRNAELIRQLAYYKKLVKA
jgi:dynactin complex subunit